jgi:hypothetical protein
MVVTRENFRFAIDAMTSEKVVVPFKKDSRNYSLTIRRTSASVCSALLSFVQLAPALHHLLI